MRNKKLWAILIVIIALIILIGLVYFMYLAPAEEEPTSQPSLPVVEQEPTSEEVAPVPAVKEKKIIPTAEITEEELKKLSASFVERYGTYSNQSGYSNIRDLKLFMSSSMQKWADNYIEDMRRQDTDTSIYYGLTTKAVVVEVTSFNIGATTAEFLVKTQRKEAAGSSANIRSFQQEAIVKMVKEGGAWKVDRVVWKE